MNLNLIYDISQIINDIDTVKAIFVIFIRVNLDNQNISITLKFLGTYPKHLLPEFEETPLSVISPLEMVLRTLK